MNEKKMMIAYDRKRTSTLTLDSQPGAHTGATRQYIPGYAAANIVFLNTSTGNDANDGTSIAQAVLTYAQAATLASTTKKIRLVNSATLTSNITKPTEATIGTTSVIASASMTAPLETINASASTTANRTLFASAWSPKLSLFVAGGGTSTDGAFFAYSSNGTTWSTSASTATDAIIYEIVWSDEDELFIAVGGAEVGESPYWSSSDGITWTRSTFSSEFQGPTYGLAYSKELGIYSACTVIDSGIARFSYSTDGTTWQISHDVNSVVPAGIAWSPSLEIFVMVGEVAVTQASHFSYSSDGITWTTSATSTSDRVLTGVSWSEPLSLFAAVGYIPSTGASYFAYSTDGLTWSNSATTTASKLYRSVAWSTELGMFFAAGGAGSASGYAYSSNGTTWTNSTATVATKELFSVSWSPLLGLFVSVGSASTDAYYTYSTAYATTVSASVAGFSIQAVQYSGTVTAYNCTLRQTGTTAALSLNSCRVNYSGSHISSNTATSLATLYIGDRYTTCTPAAQDAIDMNLDTVGGTWYIYNASETAYERIRDCLVVEGIVARYPVTITGRANIQGLSTNIIPGAEVTYNDPKFVNTTDYQLQFQTNGYARNSLAVGRSNLYFNSAGDPRDIGAWSYVESAVSYFYDKSEPIYKGFITHELEEVVSEQQGDSGEISVYGNINRLKEAVVLNYPSSRTAERAVFEYMRFITDKTVKLHIDPEWDGNPITVVVNGNQSAGVEFLTVDATSVFDGEWLTISGKKYFIYRASPNKTAATKLILDRPLENAVTDNDVISANYPSGAGEYQYAAIGKLNLSRKDNIAFELEGWRTGFSVRFVRKVSQ
jgi:hypothetical protein